MELPEEFPDDFDFDYSQCYQCSGYYGPCFNQPVCATCHAFLYPDEVCQQVSSQTCEDKTDDGDSGNEEPRESSDYPLPQLSASQDDSDDLVHHDEAESLAGQIQHLNIPSPCQLQHSPQASASGLMGDCSSGNGNGMHASLSVGDWCGRPSADTPTSYGSFSSSRPLCKPVDRLQERISMLSTPRASEDFDPSIILRIPPEVMVLVFRMLDEVSLWAVGQVCRQWNQLVLSCIPNEDWEAATKRRWPLFAPLYNVTNWHHVFTCLVKSSSCQVCLLQMPFGVVHVTHENSWRRNRLSSELRSLRSDPPEGITASPLDNMSLHWQASIRGPAGSPYQGGTFFLYIQIPPNYPLSPPVVRFITKIFHPNVSRHGDIGIDSIQHNWSLALTISKILISIQSLLTDPYTKVCMEPRIGELYNKDRANFDRLARIWTWKHAMHDAIDPETLCYLDTHHSTASCSYISQLHSEDSSLLCHDSAGD